MKELGALRVPYEGNDAKMGLGQLLEVATRVSVFRKKEFNQAMVFSLKVGQTRCLPSLLPDILSILLTNRIGLLT